MPRSSRGPDVYPVAQQFVERCLRRDDSLFQPGRPIWTADVVSEAYSAFVDHPDLSKRDFISKLEDQLSNASDEAKLLMAELLYIHLLGEADTGGDTKRERIGSILSWMSRPVGIPDDLARALNHGVANSGPGRTHRPAQVTWLLEFARGWKQLSEERRSELLADAWEFNAFVRGLPKHSASTAIEATLHLVFPDTFEDVFSVRIKEKIAGVFGYGDASIPVDRRLHDVREELEKRDGPFGTFYDDTVRPKWDTHTPAVTSSSRYWTNLYTADTWNTASEREFTITGFTAPNESGPGGYKQVVFDRVGVGDYFLCYVTGEMKWTGVLRVESEAFVDDEPIWGVDDNGEARFPVRFRVSPVVTVDPNEGVPRDEGYATIAAMTDGQKRGFFNMGLREVSVDDAQELLRRLEAHEPIHPVAVRKEKLTFDWLVAVTHWERESLEALIDAVTSSSPQIVLAGPPGTSKTWVAKHLVRFLTQDAPGRYRIVQFHPTYGYEEFIEGLRPVADRGAISFEREDGIVLSYVKEIAAETEPCFLLIDEMNRANLSRVFGELMYLFEYRDEPVDLRYTKGWKLPTKLKFIGTMNTADRSIRSIDIALRRRFDVFECPPDASVLERFYGSAGNEVPDLIDGFRELNQQLEDALDRHHTIGHAFFMASPMTADVLRALWTRKIGPLIEEYFFDQPDIANSFTLSGYWPSVGDAH